MLEKLGFGPVFKFECLSTSRRWQHFAGRVLFISFLLAALGVVVLSVETRPVQQNGIRQMAKVGEEFYLAVIGTQLALLLLAAPAVAADAICLDKSRGALVPLLTTDLSSSEIILGKLLARFLPIGGFVLCGLPVLAICFTMGGIHPEFVFGAFLVCLGVALVGGTAALTLSVWCSKTFEVLLVCYLLWICLLLLLPLSWMLPATAPTSWAKYINPYYLCFAPYMDPGSVGMLDFVYFVAGSLLLSVLLLLIATFGLRRAILRQGAAPTRPGRRNVRRRALRIPWLPRPTLDGNPVLWREWHRQRPSRWVRTVWFLYGLGALGFSIYAFILCLGLHSPSWHVEFGILVNAFQLSIGLLLVSVTSVTSLQDERTRGSLDVVLTTPLSTMGIFWGKWWGTYRVVFLLAILPTLVASGHYVREGLEHGWLRALRDGPARYFLLMPLVTCCYGAVVVSIGLALAVWIKGPGRAMATSVVIYVFLTVGVLFAAVILKTENPYVALGSSFLASGFLTEECLELFGQQFRIIPVLMMWCVFYGVGAALLSLMACRSFNRCLGRMPETMSRRFKMDKSMRRVHRIDNEQALTNV